MLRCIVCASQVRTRKQLETLESLRNTTNAQQHSSDKNDERRSQHSIDHDDVRKLFLKAYDHHSDIQNVISHHLTNSRILGGSWCARAAYFGHRSLLSNYKYGYSLGGSDRMTPSRTDANIPRSDPGLAVLMAFDIVRVGNSSTTSRSGKRAQPTNLAQGAQASRPSSMAFEASCAPAYTPPRSSFLIGCVVILSLHLPRKRLHCCQGAT